MLKRHIVYLNSTLRVKNEDCVFYSKKLHFVHTFVDIIISDLNEVLTF